MPLLLTAFAGPPLGKTPDWDAKPYVQPIANVGGVNVNGQFTLQGSAGVTGGLDYQYRYKPYWTGRTRLSGRAIYGFSSGSTGWDIRLGSFIGPNGKIARYSAGPDIWHNGYGSQAALDYYLPPSAGIDFVNHLLFKIVDPEVGFLTGVTPSWTFNPDRIAGTLGPIHELHIMAAFVIRVEPVSITVGWRRSWDAAGVRDGLILSGGL